MKLDHIGPPIHQSKLSNENCNILQRLIISKFCRNGSIVNIWKEGTDTVFQDLEISVFRELVYSIPMQNPFAGSH